MAPWSLGVKSWREALNTKNYLSKLCLTGWLNSSVGSAVFCFFVVFFFFSPKDICLQVISYASACHFSVISENPEVHHIIAQ